MSARWEGACLVCTSIPSCAVQNNTQSRTYWAGSSQLNRTVLTWHAQGPGFKSQHRRGWEREDEGRERRKEGRRERETEERGRERSPHNDTRRHIHCTPIATLPRPPTTGMLKRFFFFILIPKVWLTNLSQQARLVCLVIKHLED